MTERDDYSRKSRDLAALVLGFESAEEVESLRRQAAALVEAMRKACAEIGKGRCTCEPSETAMDLLSAALAAPPKEVRP